MVLSLAEGLGDEKADAEGGCTFPSGRGILVLSCFRGSNRMLKQTAGILDRIAEDILPDSRADLSNWAMICIDAVHAWSVGGSPA
jgi:hypothetical protein